MPFFKNLLGSSYNFIFFTHLKMERILIFSLIFSVCLGSYGEPRKQVATDQLGHPIPSLTASLSAGPSGPVLLQDTNLIDHLAHFNRERIPERVCHGKGTGAFGHFEMTNGNISLLSKAKIFSRVGKRTPVFIRFSTGGMKPGSADTCSDVRGLACKFYTDDGPWDFLGLTTEPFFVRDAMLFPPGTHGLKANPKTNLIDMNMVWDIFSNLPESTFALMKLYSSIALPINYRNIDSHAITAFKFTNLEGKHQYVKFHMVSKQGSKRFTQAEAANVRGQDPDFSIRDLYSSIEKGNFPQWDLAVQIMSQEQADAYKWDPFDSTKLWVTDQFPYIVMGTITLDRNPENHFEQVEQAAFSPANLVPGIEPSPDPLLHGRFFTYGDAHRHRLGANFKVLETNRGPGSEHGVHSYVRDGTGCMMGKADRVAPNYFPNSFGGPTPDISVKVAPYHVNGTVGRYDDVGNYRNHDDHYTQPRLWWESLDAKEQATICENIGIALRGLAPEVQKRSLNLFTEVSAHLKAEVIRIMNNQ